VRDKVSHPYETTGSLVEIERRFRGAYFLPPIIWAIVSTSETPVYFYQTTGCNIPVDSHLHFLAPLTRTGLHSFLTTKLVVHIKRQQDWKDVIRTETHRVSTCVRCTLAFTMPLAVPNSLDQWFPKCGAPPPPQGGRKRCETILFTKNKCKNTSLLEKSKYY
jgi:hypothetical protein